MSDTEPPILIDHPAPGIQRITLNRPGKRNALSTPLRKALFQALWRADDDPEIKVTIIRGAGPCFSSGYDLDASDRKIRSDPSQAPYHSAGGDGYWARHVLQGWLTMMDLAKPVIAQVHGYCLAGGSELAAACDLTYVATDARIGYPPVRLMSPPDTQYPVWLMGMKNAMEYMLLGDAMTGAEAVERGFANRHFPADQLEEEVLKIAKRVALVPSELQQFNKRSVHRAMEHMGMRAALRAGTEMQALAFHQPASSSYMKRFLEPGAVKGLLSERDRAFGDYREDDEKGEGAKERKKAKL
ncbi:enoyl-CoA hydratase/isomerase [Hyaloraphidium curvatum]|nr:enoyl-CoA hydratase/isomerase [Hyaloraphidium curvatum]